MYINRNNIKGINARVVSSIHMPLVGLCRNAKTTDAKHKIPVIARRIPPLGTSKSTTKTMSARTNRTRAIPNAVLMTVHIRDWVTTTVRSRGR
jgi:hypothetical protein